MSLYRKVLFIGFCMLVLPGTQVVFAQLPKPKVIEATAMHKVQLQHLSVNDGLSQGLIVGMLVDTKGYLWLATKEGLNRYDGNSIKVFRHDVNDPTSIGNNMGGTIMEDDDGYIWIWLDIYGLDRFDPRTERFLHLTYPEFLAAYKAAPDKNVLYNDAAGNLILPNPISQSNDTLYAHDYKVDMGRSMLQWCGLGALGNRIAAWKQDKQFVTQLLTYDGNVWLYDRDSIYRFWKNMPLNIQPSVYVVDKTRRLFVDSEGQSIYVVANDTVFGYNSTLNKFEAILTLPEGNYNLAYYSGDMQNQLLTNCDGGKTLVTDIKSGKAIWLCPNPTNGIKLPPETNYWMTQDANSNLYMATHGWGVYILTGSQTRFKVKYFGDEPFLKQLRMDSRYFKNAYIDSLKPFWTKLDTTPLLGDDYYIRVEDNRVLTITDDGHLYYNASIFHKQDHLAIGKYNIGNHTLTKFFDQLIPDSYYPGMPMMLSKTDTLLWFGDRPKNGKTKFYSVNEATGELAVYPFPVVSETAGYDFINDYYQNDEGVFWLGTIQGLFRFDTKTKSWQHFQNSPTDSSSLSENTILSILPDPWAPDSILWIGTNGGGLNKFDIKTGTFAHYTTQQGLPNNVVYSVLPDARNNFWMSTNNGLCLFNPNTLQTRNFNVANGLPGNEFNRYEFAKEADGSLHFGMVDGTVHFQPEDFYGESNNNKLVINELKLLNIPVEVQRPNQGDREGVYKLKQALEYTDELVFNYDERMITLGFALLDLSIPGNNTYKYMLEGFNTDWVDNGNNHWATFTNLDPGSYTFKVMGRNSSGIWTAEPTTIKLTILPPWWATWWFRLLMALAAMGSLYAFYRYRLNLAVKEVQLRNRIAQDLHDEIGSTLSSIALYTAVIRKKAPDLATDVKLILDKISASVLEMMSAMNDIVWTVNAINDNMGELINRMRAFAVGMTEAKEMQLNFEVGDGVEDVKMNMNMIDRKNCYLLVKEAITNAVKHADAKQLTIKLSTTADTLHVLIADNGVGFDAANNSHYSLAGNGLFGMQLRAKESNATLKVHSIPTKGTEVTFSLKVSR